MFFFCNSVITQSSILPIYICTLWHNTNRTVLSGSSEPTGRLGAKRFLIINFFSSKCKQNTCVTLIYTFFLHGLKKGLMKILDNKIHHIEIRYFTWLLLWQQSCNFEIVLEVSLKKTVTLCLGFSFSMAITDFLWGHFKTYLLRSSLN